MEGINTPDFPSMSEVNVSARELSLIMLGVIHLDDCVIPENFNPENGQLCYLPSLVFTFAAWCMCKRWKVNLIDNDSGNDNRIAHIG